MALSSFCDFNETLTTRPTSQNGLSRCIMGTVPAALLFVIVIVMTVVNALRWRRHRKYFHPKRWEINDDAEILVAKDMGLEIQTTDNDIESLFEGDPQKSFLFTAQLCFQFVLTILPLLDIITKIIISSKRLQGVVVLNDGLTVLTWLSAIWCLRTESRLYHRARLTSHSLGMLLFWTLALVLELLSFISWNNDNWWFQLRDKIQKAELGLFVVRLTCVIFVFLLGIKAPGVFKTKKKIIEEDVGEDEEDSQSSGRSKQSTFKGFWRKSKILWPFLWPSTRLLQFRVFICFCLLVVGRVVNLLLPLVYRNIVNYFTPRPNEGTLTNPIHMILVYILLRLLQGSGPGSGGLLDNARTFLWIKIQQYTSRTLQVKLFSHLHSLSLKWHLQRKTGEVLRIVDRGNQSINSLLSYLLFNITPTMVDIVIAVVYFILAFNGWFGLIVAVTMFLYLLATILVTEWRTQYRRVMNEMDNKCKGKAVDSLLNFETVKYFNAEEFEVSRYNGAIVDYQASEWWTLFSLNILNTTQNFIITAGLLVGTIYCGHLVANGVLRVGDFVLFITYMVQLYGPLNFFGTYYRMIQQAFIDMENMFDIMKVKREVADIPGAEALAVSDGRIEFRNVEFRYDPSRPILKGISFSVNPGQTVALVGPSGGGKSTIVRLLFRFYDVLAGSILVDGQDISQVAQKSLRQMIGVVPQDTVLFNDDIRYNIRYGRFDAEEDELDDAAKAADIHAKILTFPDGYKTIVGERGLKLSGGEKQRVAIARTLLKNPPLVLLDEATSALDTQTERNIQSSLNNMCVNRTTLVVAHRLSTIINANQILVLVNGEIIERGSHEELLSGEGFYYDMWMQQLKSEQEEKQDVGDDPQGSQS